MREVIEKRLRGRFEYDTGSLTFSEQRIELNLEEGEDAEGSFVVYGPADKVVEGEVSSTDLRMSVLTTSFSGARDNISYHFHAGGLKGGDVLQGYFRIISNQGEYQLPFVVSVQINHLDSELGEIRNLFHFANLARSDFKAAVQMFYDPRFSEVLSGNDAQYLGLYRGLSVAGGNEQNVEEFLLAVNKKQCTEYLPDRREIVLDNPYGDQEFLLHISRNGWGYTFLNVETDADFIDLTERTIMDGDFLGNTVTYHFTVRYDKLHVGTNLGRISFSNAFTGFHVDVRVSAPTLDAAERDVQHDLYALLRAYESFRLKQCDAQTWLADTDRILTRMSAVRERDLTIRLYRAHFNLTARRENEAEYILSETKDEVEACDDVRLQCYHQYLRLLCDQTGGDVESVTKLIREALVSHPNDWRLSWLLLYTAQEYSISASKKQHLLQDLYESGVRSPFIYLEELQLLNAQPSSLHQLDAFTMSVLRYGARHEAINEALSSQVYALAARDKQPKKDLFLILRALYEKEGSDIALMTLCEALIRAEQTDGESHPYYAAAVDRDLKITRLYEYYMMSLPYERDGSFGGEIPRAVLMYYTYQSNLEYHRAAALYRYLYERRDSLPELYASYEERISAFVKDQVARRHTDANLGVLYRHLLTREMVDKDNAASLLELLYTARITVQDERAERIVVRYHRLNAEREYPLSGGEALVPLYGTEYTILLTDHLDNRYAVTIPEETIKLMLPGHLGTYVLPYVTDGAENINLYLTEQGRGSLRVTEDNVNRYRLLTNEATLTEEARLEVRTALLRYYYEKDYIDRLSEELTNVRPEKLSAKVRGDVLDMMILAGMYDRSLEWMKSYGTFEVDPKTIVRLFSRMMDAGTLPQDESVTRIAYYAFRKGKYDERLLRFLTESFHGLTREMRDIWKASAGFSIDTYDICERIIIQMLYTGAYIGDRMHVFRDYVNRTGNAEVEIAFLSQCAYDSFVKDRVMEEYIFERIARQHLQGSHLDIVCKLAYLKHFSETKTGGAPDKEVVRDFLMHLTKERRVFAFYQDYLSALPQMVTYADKTIVEYKSRPGNRCVLHYLDASEAEGEGYKSVPMKEQYDGIYVTTFTLFFGEQMQYYITESSGGKEEATQSGTIAKNDIAQTSHAGRFDLINDIMIGEALHDYETVDRLLEEYYRRQFIATRLFRPVTEKQDA